MRKREQIGWAVVMGLVVVFGLSVAGCGDEEDEEIANLEPEEEEEEQLEVESEEPMLHVDPVRLEFSASVGPGEEEEKTLIFTNIGDEDLHIWDVELNAFGSDAFSPGRNWPTGEFVLESLESHELTMWYRPQDGESHNGAISMMTNDPERMSPTSIPLSSEAHDG